MEGTRLRGCWILAVLLAAALGLGSAGPAAALASPSAAQLLTVPRPTSSLSLPTVNSTLVLANGTVVAGNYAAATGLNPLGSALDPVDGKLFVADCQSDSVAVINTTTDRAVDYVPLPYGPYGAVYDPGNGLVYTSDGCSSPGWVSVINATTDALLTNVRVGQTPRGIALDPVHDRVYVVNYYSGNVSVIDGATNRVVASVAVGVYPFGAAFDPLTDEILVTNELSFSVSVINTTSESESFQVPVGWDPSAIAFDPANGHVFVVNAGSDNITVLDGSGNATNTTFPHRALAWFPEGAWPSDNGFELGIDPAANVAFVANAVNDSVSVIDATANAVVGSFPIHSPETFTFDAAHGRFFVSSGWATVALVDPVTRAVVGSIPVGAAPEGLAYDPANGDLYVANLASDNVSVVDPSSGRIKSWIDVGVRPMSIAVDPATGDVYVTNYGSANVSRINGTTNRVVGSAPVGPLPADIAYNPADGDLYTTSYGYRNVSRIDGATGASAGTVPLWDGGDGIVVDPLTGLVYVSHPGSANVTASNPSPLPGGGGVVASFAVGIGPTALAYDAATYKVYVANTAAGTVSVISTITRAVIGTVDTGGHPSSLAVASSTGEVFVSQLNSRNLTVIDGTTDTVLGNMTVGLTGSPLSYMGLRSLAFDSALGRLLVADGLAGSLSLVPVGAPSDVTPPDTTAIVGGAVGMNGWYTSTVDVALHATDGQSGVAALYVRLDNASWATYTGPVAIGAGRHTLAYYAVDNAGNAEPQHALPVRVDLDSPELTATGPSGLRTTSAVTLRWTAADNTSGIASVQVSVDGGAFQDEGAATNASLTLPDGPHTVVIQAVDVAGLATNQTFSFRIDTNPFSLSGPYAGAPTYAILIAAVAVAAAAIVWRRRKQDRPPPP